MPVHTIKMYCSYGLTPQLPSLLQASKVKVNAFYYSVHTNSLNLISHFRFIIQHFFPTIPIPIRTLSQRVISLSLSSFFNLATSLTFSKRDIPSFFHNPNESPLDPSFLLVFHIRFSSLFTSMELLRPLSVFT